MVNLKVYQEYGDELERRLRLKTFPLAIKMLESEKDIPEGAKRPLKDFGHHFSLCQVFQMSRREGRTMAMVKEDHWCFEPVVGYGLGEPRIILCRATTGSRETWPPWRRGNITPMNFHGWRWGSTSEWPLLH